MCTSHGLGLGTTSHCTCPNPKESTKGAIELGSTVGLYLLFCTLLYFNIANTAAGSVPAWCSAWINTLRHSYRLLLLADSNGVYPLLSWATRAAPAASNATVAAGLLLNAAQCSGVFSLPHTAERSAPAETNALMMVVAATGADRHAAMHSGVMRGVIGILRSARA